MTDAMTDAQRPPGDALADIAWLATQVCAAPQAFVCLAGGHHAGQAWCDAAMAQPEAVWVVPDARLAGHPLVTGPDAVRFVAAAVLRPVGGAPLGALCVTDTQPRELSAVQRRALAVLADQAVAQCLLRRPAPEGEALEQWLAQEWARHARRGESLATLAMAVEGGDAAAPAVVQQLVTDALRTSDHVAPIDGLRLAAVLPGSGLGTAMAAAQRVRLAVERHGWGGAPVTLSLGVAAMLAAPGSDAAQLRARAEHALQLAQRQGRSRVAAFSGW